MGQVVSIARGRLGALAALAAMYQGYDADGNPVSFNWPDGVPVPELGTRIQNQDGSYRYFGPTGWTSYPPVIIPGLYAGLQPAPAPTPVQYPSYVPPPVYTAPYTSPVLVPSTPLPPESEPLPVTTATGLPTDPGFFGKTFEIGDYAIPVWTLAVAAGAFLFFKK